MSSPEVVGGRFRHMFGKFFDVLYENAVHSGTRARCVIYRGCEDGIVYVRPATDFFGHTDDGVRRFTPVERKDPDQ